MKPGQESGTAVMVCMGRAVAHGATGEARFDDPTALALLPAGARARVERFRSGEVPKGLHATIRHGYLARQSRVMVARTVALDDAVRAAASPQLVVLGAGLDGRAFRMGELAETVVFEVDHPDSQREKVARTAALSRAAREVRFVPVVLGRDSLDCALAAAGHDPARPTTWLCEGVVMYLARAEVEAMLAAVARRSAPGSRLAVLYHRPALLLWLVGAVLRWMGEPLRSAFAPEAMAALLAGHGFRVATDEDLVAIGGRMSPDVAAATRRMSHLRIAVAERRGS